MSIAMRFRSNKGSVSSASSTPPLSFSSGSEVGHEDDSKGSSEAGCDNSTMVSRRPFSPSSIFSHLVLVITNNLSATTNGTKQKQKTTRAKRVPPTTFVEVSRKADKHKSESHTRGGAATKHDKAQESKNANAGNEISLTSEQEQMLNKLHGEGKKWSDIAKELGFENKDIQKLKSKLDKRAKKEPEKSEKKDDKEKNQAKGGKQDGGSKKGAVKESKAKVLQPDENWSAEEVRQHCSSCSGEA